MRSAMSLQISGLVIAGFLAAAGTVNAQAFFEGFNDEATPADWVSVSASPLTGTNPFWTTRIGDGPFASFEGSGYVSANYLASALAGDIRLFLESPVVQLQNGNTISFWTRTVAPANFPDRLRVVISTDGASTLSSSFQSTLLTINNDLTTTGFPTQWTLYTAIVSGVDESAGPVFGRFAFLYDVPQAGPDGINGNFVGIDAVQFIPTPGAAGLIALGALAALRRRR